MVTPARPNPPDVDPVEAVCVHFGLPKPGDRILHIEQLESRVVLVLSHDRTAAGTCWAHIYAVSPAGECWLQAFAGPRALSQKARHDAVTDFVRWERKQGREPDADAVRRWHGEGQGCGCFNA